MNASALTQNTADQKIIAELESGALATVGNAVNLGVGAVREAAGIALAAPFKLVGLATTPVCTLLGNYFKVNAVAGSLVNWVSTKAVEVVTDNPLSKPVLKAVEKAGAQAATNGNVLSKAADVVTAPVKAAGAVLGAVGGALDKVVESVASIGEPVKDTAARLAKQQEKKERAENGETSYGERIVGTVLPFLANGGSFVVSAALSGLLLAAQADPVATIGIIAAMHAASWFAWAITAPERMTQVGDFLCRFHTFWHDAADNIYRTVSGKPGPEKASER